jgi:type I restriction enzyme M protein
MSPETHQIVQKLWNFSNLLRDDGLSYGDYVEQLSYLLFLKMAHEQTLPPWNRPSPVPEGYDWPSLDTKDGAELEIHYRNVLETLGKKPGMLGLIFRKAQNRVQDPAKLKRLVSDLIGKESWVMVGADVKGDAYEGLLEKNAQDTKSGAGQYFTPRAVIDAMVKCVDPKPGEKVTDPAAGTGGFLLAAHSHVTSQNPELTREQREHLRLDAFRGVEIVQDVTRLCAMNLLLHGVGPSPYELDARKKELIQGGKSAEEADAEIERRLPVRTDDALRDLGGDRFDVVLTNPPFGRKSSVVIVGEDGKTQRDALSYEREDFWVTTSNKQLNFVQHVKSLLAIHGRAGVVLPDNVLFEGGAGETIRRRLMQECDLHTILRLPTGIFYAQGVKANVLFFDRKPASPNPWTRRVWFYDLRTNKHFTLKANPLRHSDLDEFVELYQPGAIHAREPTWSEENPEGRWRAYDHNEILARDKCSLDIFWLRDESLLDADSLGDPDEIAEEIVADLAAALDQMREIVLELGGEAADI